MHKFLFFLLSITSFSATFSQQDSVKPDRNKYFRHQLGVNTTFFIRNLVDLSTSNFDLSPYIITYKYIAPSGWGFRSGMGFSYVDVKREENGLDIADNAFEINTRMGFEYQLALGRRWAASFGVDVLLDYKNKHTVTNSGFDVVTLSTFQTKVGGGPTIGITYKPSRRIGIGTETSLYYKAFFNTERQEFQAFPEFSVEKNNTGNSILFLLPTSFYLTINL